MTSASSPGPPRIDMESVPHQVAPPLRPPLRRSTTDKMLGGVCGGLAEHTGVDSLVWRAAFVAVTLAGGAGVLVYLLLWVLMPPGARADGQEPGRLDRLAEQAHQKVYATGWLPPRS